MTRANISQEVGNIILNPPLKVSVAEIAKALRGQYRFDSDFGEFVLENGRTLIHFKDRSEEGFGSVYSPLSKQQLADRFAGGLLPDKLIAVLALPEPRPFLDSRILALEEKLPPAVPEKPLDCLTAVTPPRSYRIDRMFAEKSVSQIVGSAVDCNDNLSGVQKLMIAFGSDFDTAQTCSLEEGAELIRQLFISDDSHDSVVVVPHVGNFAVRLGGFHSELDGWGDQTAVLHRVDSDSVQATFYFSDKRVELYHLPRKPDDQVSLRQPDAGMLVFDLFDESGKLIGGLGMKMGHTHGEVSFYRKTSGGI